jgi:hypothetical protein
MRAWMSSRQFYPGAPQIVGRGDDVRMKPGIE